MPGLVARALRCTALVVLAAASVFGAREAQAHRMGESYLYLQVYSDRVEGRFEISRTDLNQGLGLAGTDGEITKANLDEHAAFLKDYFRRHVTISDSRGPLTIRFDDLRYSGVRGGNFMLPFAIEGLDGVPGRLDFDYSVLFDEVPTHRGLLIIEHNWATGTFANEAGMSGVFTPAARQQSLDIQSGNRLRGFLSVVRLGTDHIWKGLDHVVFLFALLLPAVLRRENGRWEPVERFRPALINVIKIVTAFTVAHTLTLSLAALGVIDLPSRFIESVIAASIAIAAADILFPILHRRVWLVAFFFGLFHGFGFAGALAEMGLLRENLGLSLLGFNLGVEVGQVIIVAAAFPFLFLLRRVPAYRMPGIQAAAVVMILVASVWFYERVFDVATPVSAAVGAFLRNVAS
jgi:HupE / UreJ protein